MAKSDVPISLFSFQDIVTSLTGIMVIVILVIALQMMETTQELERQPEDPEWQELLEENQRLQATLAALKSGQMPDDSPEAEEFQLLLAMDEAEVEALLADARHQLQASLDELAQAEAMCEQAAAELADLTASSAAVRDDAREQLEILKAQMQQLAEELDNLEEEIAALREQVRVLELAKVDLEGQGEMKAKKLNFAFTGSRNYTPILVECLGGNRFKGGVYLSKDVMDFTSLEALCRWLGRFDTAQYYPVLLIRKNAFADEGEIVAAVEKTVMRLGKDPIPNDVEVFQ